MFLKGFTFFEGINVLDQDFALILPILGTFLCPIRGYNKYYRLTDTGPYNRPIRYRSDIGIFVIGKTD